MPHVIINFSHLTKGPLESDMLYFDNGKEYVSVNELHVPEAAYDRNPMLYEQFRNERHLLLGQPLDADGRAELTEKAKLVEELITQQFTNAGGCMVQLCHPIDENGVIAVDAVDIITSDDVRCRGAAGSYSAKKKKPSDAPVW